MEVELSWVTEVELFVELDEGVQVHPFFVGVIFLANVVLRHSSRFRFDVLLKCLHSVATALRVGEEDVLGVEFELSVISLSFLSNIVIRFFHWLRILLSRKFFFVGDAHSPWPGLGAAIILQRPGPPGPIK